MRLFVFTGLLLQVFVASAAAADLPLKAPPPPPVLSTWTGVYAGINVGYSYGHDPYDAGLPGFVAPASSLAAPGGALFGGQVGYNWQVGRFVFGLEGDGQWTGQRDIGCGAPECALNSVPESGAFMVSDRLAWFATARGRLGLATERYLLYVTGGAAWAGFRQTQSANLDFVQADLDHRTTLTGYAVGLGGEAALGSNLSVKVEYLYLDYGHVTNQSFLVGGNGVISFADLLTTTSAVRDNVIRVGLNYHPAGVPMPATATPAGTYTNWSGFYLGVNGGYGVANDRVTQFDATPTDPVVQFFGSFRPAKVGPTGGFAGGQLGYNWQIRSIVLGVEGDGQWSAQRDEQCGGISCTVLQKLPWFATLRGRIGWAEPSYLLYLTGGAAWGGIHEVDTIDPALPAVGFDRTRLGWTFGGGIETRLWDRWTGKIEFLHIDLGSTSNLVVVSPLETFTTTSTIRNDVVRVGLNYNLGG